MTKFTFHKGWYHEVLTIEKLILYLYREIKINNSILLALMLFLISIKVLEDINSYTNPILSYFCQVRVLDG